MKMYVDMGRGMEIFVVCWAGVEKCMWFVGSW